MKRKVIFFASALMALLLLGIGGKIGYDRGFAAGSVNVFQKSVPFAGERSTVCFTPGEDCTGLIVQAINAEDDEILVQAFNFTSKPILKALVEAKRRKVDVRIILDKSNEQERYDGGTCMVDRDIYVVTDSKVKIAHSKVMIFGRKHVLRGSFNFTESAQHSNAENTELTINNPELASKYIKNWQKRATVSRPFNNEKDAEKCSF